MTATGKLRDPIITGMYLDPKDDRWRVLVKSGDVFDHVRLTNKDRMFAVLEAEYGIKRAAALRQLRAAGVEL